MENFYKMPTNDELRHNYHTINNFAAAELGWYDKAVKLCNKRNKNAHVYIASSAFDCNGRKISGWHSVMYTGEDPRQIFWECFKLVKTKHPEPPVARKVRIKKGPQTPLMCTWSEEMYRNRQSAF